VGNASAGKSYYLSVLAKVMPDVMFQQLGIVWQDADPAGNAGLNDMKSRLFGSLDAEGAALEKTVLGGAMYATVPRFGRKVAMPRPFVFSITPQKRPENQTTCIFYDNAGEHFRPDVSIDDSPGALHVASASGIIFLFDPTRNLEFRRRLRGHDDPQLGLDMNDVQDVILAEMKVRLMKMKNLPPTTKVATPLAVVVGKCDAWLPLLEGKEGRHLVNCVDSKGLDLGHVAMNSAAVRELLLETCPTIVAGAESLSSDVVYFGASAFGHTPVRTSKGTIAPDPNFLNPILVEVPVLWLLSRLGTKLIPTVPAPGRSSRTS
jgi:hypothetical protein